MHKPDDIASRLLGMPLAKLDARAQGVARHVAARTAVSRHPSHLSVAKPTVGQRAADAVASFGGSWTFVGLFAAVMLIWVLLNTYLLASRGSTFDPYPYILLNLFLSMLAAIQMRYVDAVFNFFPQTKACKLWGKSYRRPLRHRKKIKMAPEN